MKTYIVTVKMYQYDDIRVQAEDEEQAKRKAEQFALWHGWNEVMAEFEAVDVEELKPAKVINEIS
uniref:Uncharacterized protein n=1 Tax=viral metagenome TaxID=1070528 RepID=A0A6M3LQ05_9ZZZZ